MVLNLCEEADVHGGGVEFQAEGQSSNRVLRSLGSLKVRHD